MFLGPNGCEYSLKPKFISGIFFIYYGTVRLPVALPLPFCSTKMYCVGELFVCRYVCLCNCATATSGTTLSNLVNEIITIKGGKVRSWEVQFYNFIAFCRKICDLIGRSSDLIG